MIGEKCNIGQNVVIRPDVRIGKGCKIQNNVSVYQGVTLEDGVFLRAVDGVRRNFWSVRPLIV